MCDIASVLEQEGRKEAGRDAGKEREKKEEEVCRE